MDPVDSLLAELVESLPTTPAVLVNARWDVIASNPVARAVSPRLAVGVNLAEATFIDESARRTLPEWREVSRRMVALLKHQLEQTDAGDPRVHGLRNDLARRSDDFSRAWHDDDRPDAFAVDIVMDHPDVGRMELGYELLRVPGTDQTLVLGHAAPGSDSERRLFELVARLDADGT
ncbi:hypothetical protein QT381_01085 [Galbitalea sp. SE-J8]|uniref:MmyB family transcriptional regulator n=1 Tax=Galbitalea sp. SE-J8 TaxID=3054952 RepID=UPI00259D18E8|nr:hypothetical protein [Galbitalea sp. SE-J8]MDM4761602.1 hypothetical protein [Galbitalea sp. SE-J8]